MYFTFSYSFVDICQKGLTTKLWMIIILISVLEFALWMIIILIPVLEFAW